MNDCPYLLIYSFSPLLIKNLLDIISMRQILLLLSILLLLGQATAQEPLSLDRAIEIGIANNYQLKITKDQLQVAANNNTWSAAGRGPQVDASINLQNGYLNSRAAGFLRQQSTFNTGITPAIDGTWVIYDGNRAKVNKRQLEELELQGRRDVEITIENTVQSIILAYYQVLIQEELLSTLQEVLDLSRDRINYQEVRKEFGQAGTFDILQTTDAYLNDSTNILIQQNNIETAQRNLNLVMGETEVLKSYQLTDILEFQPINFELPNLEEMMFANNKALLDLIGLQEIAALNTRLQETSKRPNISLAGGLSYNLSGSTGDGILNAGGMESPIDLSGSTKAFNFYLGAIASYNLYDGGNRNRTIENAQVEELIAKSRLDDLKRNLSSQLQTTLANYRNQVRLVQLTEVLIENARKSLTIGQERFDSGQISSFDYRAIQLAFVNATQARLNAIFNLKNTETSILQLTGQLVKETE